MLHLSKIQLLIPGEGQNRTIEPQIEFLPLASPLRPEKLQKWLLAGPPRDQGVLIADCRRDVPCRRDRSSPLRRNAA